ncbi:MAG: inosine monophosphate cyclohydrolase, partial [Clostridia bacterium]|nr:inosine monophosphate cyclohydrolase [Clostridia bacterium]
ACNHRFFYEYDAPIAGFGHFIHTYQENLDPLPSFEGEPRRVICDAPNAQAFADLLWANLNEDNKVSLYVAYVDLATGETDTVIVNKNV